MTNDPNQQPHQEPSLEDLQQSSTMPNTRLSRDMGATKQVNPVHRFISRFGVSIAIAIAVIGFSGGFKFIFGGLWSIVHPGPAAPTGALTVGITPLPSGEPSPNADIGANVASQANSQIAGLPVGGRSKADTEAAVGAPQATPTPAVNNAAMLKNAIGQTDATTDFGNLQAPPPAPPSLAQNGAGTSGVGGTGGTINTPMAPPSGPTVPQAPSAGPTPAGLGSGNDVVPPPGSQFVASTSQNQQGGVVNANTIAVQNKAAFLDESTSTDNLYLDSKETPARSENEVFFGTPAYAILDDAIVSSVPGYVFAHLTGPVKCSLAPYPICFPEGTRVRGVYNADTNQGDSRMQVRWEAFLLPNGTTFPLRDMQAADLTGANGLPADVDNHVGRVYTSLFIGTLLNVGANLLSGGSYGALSAPTLGQAAAQGVGQTALGYANSKVQAAQQQAPTLGVPKGRTFEIKFSATALVKPYSQTHVPNHTDEQP